MLAKRAAARTFTVNPSEPKLSIDAFVRDTSAMYFPPAGSGGRMPTFYAYRVDRDVAALAEAGTGTIGSTLRDSSPGVNPTLLAVPLYFKVGTTIPSWQAQLVTLRPGADDAATAALNTTAAATAAATVSVAVPASHPTPARSDAADTKVDDDDDDDDSVSGATSVGSHAHKPDTDGVSSAAVPVGASAVTMIGPALPPSWAANGAPVPPTANKLVVRKSFISHYDVQCCVWQHVRLMLRMAGVPRLVQLADLDTPPEDGMVCGRGLFFFCLLWSTIFDRSVRVCGFFCVFAAVHAASHGVDGQQAGGVVV